MTAVRVLALLLTYQLSLVSTAAQKLTINKTTIDVGKTGYMVPVTATFELRNKSNKPMNISDLRPEFGCTN